MSTSPRTASTWPEPRHPPRRARPRHLPGTARTRLSRRALEVLAAHESRVSRRDWRYYRERQRQRGRSRASAPRNAREAIEGLLESELGAPRLSGGARGGSGASRRRGRAKRAPPSRSHRAAHLHRRPRHRARLRRRDLGPARGGRACALGPHRRRRRPREARHELDREARDGPTAPTCQARSSRCCRAR